MNLPFQRLACCCVVLLYAGILRAQQLPGAEKETPAPLGVEKFYWDLTKSEDRVLKTMAERYVNLVKVQEWSDLSGKFKAVAYYVKHDPTLTTVTIRVMKGKGADRSSDEKTVPVDKLSKTCQSRVKQIDTMQKKLKEAAAKSKDGAGGVPGATPENPGAPMTDERGAEPGAAGPGPGPGPGPAGPPAVAAPDPSASEPDPLGFAEIQFDQPGAGPGPGPGPEGGPVRPPTGR